MNKTLENMEKLSTLSKDRFFLNSLMEDLASAYHSYCFLNMEETEVIADKLGLEVTFNKVLKKNIVVSWMIALCKIYEKPSPNNPSNVNIHKFLSEMKKQLLPLSEQIQMEKNELLKWIEDIEKGIEDYKEIINISYMWRNKSLAHIDSELLMPKFKNSNSPNFDINTESEKYFNRLIKRMEKLQPSLYKLTEFTIRTLDSMLVMTQEMGAEFVFDRAFNSPDTRNSIKEIEGLYKTIQRK